MAVPFLPREEIPMFRSARTSSVRLFFLVILLLAGGGQLGAQSTAAPRLLFLELPAVSPLGARNDLPDPYRPGVSWGQLPNGRKWGSTAGIAIGPDGNIWAIDRCGASGSSGTNCFGSPLDPILEFDPSGKFLKSFGAGLFVSPHKITVDKDGYLWVADNGIKDGRGQQVFKFDQNGKVLLTLGKAGVTPSTSPPRSPSRPTATSSSPTAMGTPPPPTPAS
jgi:hypothetical protein